MVELWREENIAPRMRAICDNDFAGDPDGLVQLAHLLLSPTVETTALIATRLRDGDVFWNRFEKSAAAAYDEVAKLFEVMSLPKVPLVIAGPEQPLRDRKTPIDSPGAREIIREAMRDDTKLPLFVLCGASLTEIASAWLLEPRIAERLTVIWIGGHEHEGLAVPPPGGTDMEYNLHIDPIAGQVVFNDSNLRLWQVPRDSYRSANTSRSEMLYRMYRTGKLGHYLYNKLGEITDRLNEIDFPVGESYILGDSPLVLLSALQSTFEADPTSTPSVELACPNILDSGLYQANPSGRTIRVFGQLDNRLMLEDMYAKFAIHGESHPAV